MNYSYNPDNISKNGIDRMRFELGDTVFNPGELTAALTDAEYEAVLSRYPENFKRAKLECLKAILMKFSHQVSMKVGPVSYNFSDRVKFWQDMYNSLKSEARLDVPVMASSITYGEGSASYFYADLHSNKRKGY